MHLPSLDQIRAASDELNQLYERLSASVEERGQLWTDLCNEFHRRYDQLSFPGGAASLSKVRERDPVSVELAVRFLLADPYHFRSGYTKQYLWRWLVRIPLSRHQRGMLEQAALKYIDRKVSREFWNMAKAMHKIARPGFWLEVGSRVDSADQCKHRRALLFLLFGANIHAGAKARCNIHRGWLKQNFGGS